MNLARTRRGAAALHQRGFALIAILALAAMITAFLIAIGMNRSSAEISNEREDRSMSALKQAKTALIAYAANEQWQVGGTTPFQPGAFPCPDRDNDGIAEDHEFPQKPCNTALKRIGRFPWQTIGADDLRDSSGERLWYAVSASFLKNTPAYTNIINSDTQGQLTVNGTAASNAIVAVVFAPGQPIQGQVRDPTDPVGYNNPANFLEQFNGATSTYSQYNTATYDTFYSTGLPSKDFNDRLLVITQADVMAAVEPVVAANIERDIAPYIRDYYGTWLAYPYAVPFDPTLTPQSQYKGASGQARGLLPVTTDTSFVGWDTSSIVLTEIAGGTGAGTGSPSPAPPPYIFNSPPDCGSSTSTQIVCKVDYSNPPWTDQDRPNIQLQAKILNAGRAFPKAYGIADAVMTGSDGFPVEDNGSTYKYWSPVPPDPPFPNTPPSVSNTLNSNGDGIVVFTGRLQNNGNPPTGTGGKVTITITLNSHFEPFTDPSTANPVGWFVANEWHRQTFYAVSPGFLPNSASIYGGTGCSPGGTPAPSCLSVANLRPSYTTLNNKQVILVLAGRSLNGTRPPASATPAAYFENANLTAATPPFATFAFENRPGNPTSINDRVVVVSP